jgi:CRP-like cAMP-binding protein
MRRLIQDDAKEIYIRQNNINNLLSDDLISKLELHTFKSKEYICRYGIDISYLYFLVKGTCKVFKTLKNGKESLICFYNSFQILGEFELFSDSTAKTNVQTINQVTCLAISTTKYKDALLNDVKLLKFLCKNLCSKLIRTDMNASIHTSYPLEQRLASYIIFAKTENVFSTNYTHLADFLGCSHRHLLRTLNNLCKKEILEKNNDSYIIKDMNYLKESAGDSYK